ncbi:hypothetical protein Hte_001938 [Hypoxylon texense]
MRVVRIRQKLFGEVLRSETGKLRTKLKEALCTGIELAFYQNEDEELAESLKSLHATADLVPKSLDDLASKLREKVEQLRYLGEDYRIITKKLINCDFGLGKDHLHEQTLRNEVYRAIVGELDASINTLGMKMTRFH